ncbi:toprim domain-containing protein [Ottowia beijingensis]|uniref:Toprim domain-containing protein n=1 Tax=Ottowia beijingensis TaxID=1207057 RepID=A0A853IYK1_9BURK|nr:toprim domain-containing protein [Ottowia beijingensis]NZA02858.1 toprim domain-containing protein [Ottowia beijingensis]
MHGSTNRPIRLERGGHAHNPFQKKITANDALDYTGLIGPVACHFWGDPNEQLSKPSELRFGSHGSKSVDLEKNLFFDHEADEGGGVIKLVQYGTGIKERGAAHQWLLQNGFIGNDRASTPAGREVMQVMKSCPAPAKSAPAPKASKAPTKIVSTYDYRNEQGELLMQVVRMEPKTFRQRRPDGERWSWSVKDVRVVPYRLPELAAAPDAVVYLVEGEKDADRLASLGLVATCNAGGAGKWRKEHSEFLRGRHVVVLPDNDDAGREHARKAVKALRGIATDVRVVELPDLPEKGDVSDWLDAGGSVAALEDMLKEAPAANAEPGEDEPEKKPSQTDLLVKFVRERFDLLHDKNGDTYASDRHTGEVRRMGARQFRDRVTAGFFAQMEIAVRDQSWREALGTLQALARFEGDPQDVYIRVAGCDGRYWIDLCHAGNSHAVELTKTGWRVVERPRCCSCVASPCSPSPCLWAAAASRPCGESPTSPSSNVCWCWPGWWTHCALTHPSPAWSWWANKAAARAPPLKPCAA